MAGPGLVQVGLDRADPVAEPGLRGCAVEVLQHRRGDIHRDHLGVRHLPGQREGGGAGARAQVDDARPAAARAATQVSTSR